ncbi:MAG: helix-turn-helix domain-containing protein [Fibromonadales bacterium]|nr:helix-turn-helix domain-containing protein [Fibromonadales bacterium]
MKTELKQEPTGDREVKIVAGQEYWCPKKAARYLGISKVSLWNHAKQNLITKLCMCGQTLYKKEWLDEFINERTTIGLANRKGGKK